MRHRERLFLVMVGLLPLHTVYLSAWISWKPFLVLVGGLGVWDLVDGIRFRTWPWHRQASRSLAHSSCGGGDRFSGAGVP